MFMKKKSTLLFFIKELKVSFYKKNLFFKEVFSFALFTLFFGFLIGNLFATFLNTIRSIVLWDGFIVLIIVATMEFLNFVLYTQTNLLVQKKKKKEIVWKSVNCLKIGVLFGFFIDAFKVGS